MDDSILIGSGITGKSVFLNLGSPETNGHLMLLGESGSGKTYCTEIIISELKRIGNPVYILDLTGSLSRKQGEPEFFRNVEEQLDFINVTNKGLPINLFERLMMDEENLEKVCDLAGRVADSLTAGIGGGELQGALLYKYIKTMLSYCDHSGEESSLELLGIKLSEERGITAKKVLGKMSQLIDGNYFRGELSQLALGNEGAIKLMQMQAIPHSVKQFLTDLILWQIWSYGVQNGSKDNPVYILIDEFQNVRFTPSSPLYKILCEGRKFGLNLILATQFFREKFSNSVEMAVAQVVNKIFFRPPDGEAKLIASFITQDRNGIKDYEAKLKKLRRGEAFIKGDVYNRVGHGSGRVGEHLKKS